MRSNIIILILVVILALPKIAISQQTGLGLGVILGEPTGISMKSWLSRTTALDFAAAWSFGDYQSFQFHADYLLHNTRVFERQLPLYYGVGGRLKLKEDHNGRHGGDAHVGIRFPVGVTYLFQQVPFDFFIEIVPILDVSPETEVKFNAAMGGRFYIR